MPPAAPEAPEEAPSSGIGLMVTGGILMGVGALNLASSAICKTDAVARSIQDGCFIGSLALGGTLFTVGVPLLIVGAVKRSTYKEWLTHHPEEDGALGFSVASGGGALTFRGRF